MNRPSFSAVIIMPVVLTTHACMRPTVRVADVPASVDVAELWVEPHDLAERDLLHGPGTRELLPDHTTPFEFVAEDRSGYSAGYDVRDAEGVTWSVKLGPEAQPEVGLTATAWSSSIAAFTTTCWTHCHRMTWCGHGA